MKSTRQKKKIKLSDLSYYKILYAAEQLNHAQTKLSVADQLYNKIKNEVETEIGCPLNGYSLNDGYLEREK